MTKKEKVKNFVKEHKKEVIVYFACGAYGAYVGIGMICTIKRTLIVL